MSEKDNDHNLIREYLLGRLDETYRDSLEQRFLLDRELVQTVAVIESGLIDDYILGSLPVEDRQAFDAFFLSTPERMEKLSFSRSLRDCAEETVLKRVRSVKETERPRIGKWFWQRRQRLIWTTAIALFVVIAAGGSLLLRQEWQARWNAAALERELAALNPPEEPRPDIANSIGPLQPGGVRGNSSEQGYAISANANVVQLSFGVPPDDIAVYQVRKETDEGITIFALQLLRPSYVKGEKQILVNLPSRILQPGYHYFRISGTSDSGELKDIGVYNLKIVRSE